MSLKEATKAQHNKAERSAFVRNLLQGKMSPELYYRYLTNQFFCYNLLEQGLRDLGFDASLHGIFRATKIRDDLNELEEQHGFSYSDLLMTRSTHRYQSYVQTLIDAADMNRLLAHTYVRHFGDMYGGSIIAGYVPGSGSMYVFENKDQLIEGVRALLTDDMADEANECFRYANDLFLELLPAIEQDGAHSLFNAY